MYRVTSYVYIVSERINLDFLLVNVHFYHEGRAMTRLVDLSPVGKVISCPILKNDGLNILISWDILRRGENSMVSTVFYLLKSSLP